ncbi:MAG: DNA-binding response regulator [Alphaproteobacteria bacterium]|nr:MAG: DNA-binding response regulator [Alphaproteobacteria bacterium]
MSGSGKITVAIVDDHEIVRRGLANVLEGETDIEIVLEADTAGDAIRKVPAAGPDVLVLDLGIPDGGESVLSALARKVGAPKCVVFTATDDPRVALRVMRLGAAGFVLKGLGANEIATAIRAVAKGESYVSPAFAGRLVAAAQGQESAEKPAAGLTHRELQIITEVAKGRTNREIGEILNISEKTVKHYMTSLMQKLGVTNRVAAVLAYRKIYGDDDTQQH